jgi:hypothetical protein
VMEDTTKLKRRMSTPAHPDGDPTLMVVEILRITKERDALQRELDDITVLGDPEKMRIHVLRNLAGWELVSTDYMARLRESAAENAALRDDKARLDKIQKLALENPIHKDDGFTYYRGWGYNPCEEHGVTPFSLRAAIDAAKGVGHE